MLFFVYLLADLDEGRQMDSILKAVGAVKYEYGGWEIANFDTLPLSDSIPAPDGEYRIVDGYKALHLRGVWEYRDRKFRTRLLKPGMASYLRGYPLDLLDWGRYLVFYIRGKGRYHISAEIVYKGFCRWFVIRNLNLDTFSASWTEVRIDLDTLGKIYNIIHPPEWIWADGNSPACWAWGKDDKGSGFVPLRWGIAPLADTFGTYEYEMELSPIYLVR